MSDILFDQAEKVLRDITQSLGNELRSANGNIASTQKANNQGPVTELDKKAERLIKAGLAQLDDGIGFNGEEYGTGGSTKTYWTIDPIDGTESFIRGFPNCYNMVSLIDDNEVKFAFVYQFMLDKTYVARRGNGAYLNGKKLSVSSREMSDSWILTQAGVHQYINLIERMSSVAAHVITSGNILAIAEGGIEAYVSTPDGSRGHVWDYAPRALIIEEAGGHIANVGSKSYDPKVNSLIAANPVIFEELHKLVLSSEA